MIFGVRHGGMAYGTALLLAGMVAGACGGSGGAGGGSGGEGGGNNVDLNGSGYVSNQLATGTVATLPSGTLYIRVINVSQAPSQPTAVSVSGIVYVLSGSLMLSDKGTVTSANQKAAFIGPATQVSSSESSTTFYLISVNATSTRSATPPYPGAQLLYGTEDLPSLPVVKQDETLFETTLQKGGFSPAHRPNGVELIIDLQGTLDLGLGGKDVKHMKAGEANYVLQGSFVQLINRGSGTAHYLSFFLLPNGMQLTVPAK